MPPGKPVAIKNKKFSKQKKTMKRKIKMQQDNLGSSQK